MKPPKIRRLFYNLLKTKSRSFQNERDRIFSKELILFQLSDTHFIEPKT